jgi:hypothetical protein
MPVDFKGVAVTVAGEGMATAVFTCGGGATGEGIATSLGVGEGRAVGEGESSPLPVAGASVLT